jgi:hypothetical protein
VIFWMVGTSESSAACGALGNLTPPCAGTLALTLAPTSQLLYHRNTELVVTM